MLDRTYNGTTVGGDWVDRRNQWFTNYRNVIQNAPMDALPNYLQLGAYGDPSDEFKFEPTGTVLAGAPTSRNLIARTFADADGDGFTDSFWFVAPSSSDRDTRQLVAVSITDNSALLNVNIASRFNRTNTIGQTPSDVALVTLRESFDQSTPVGSAAAGLDTAVGFLNSRENDPEYRASRKNPYTTPSAADLPFLIYPRTTSGGTPSTGVDVGFDPVRWEGLRTQPAAPAATAADNTQASFMQSIGLMMHSSTSGGAAVPVPLFDPTTDYSLGAAGGAGYGGWFLLTRPADRLTYFKAQANGGELVDPVTSARLVTLSPFGMDDEIELRATSGLNSAATVSRLEAVLGNSGPVALNGSGVIGQPGSAINAFNPLRSSRSREESVRFLEPNDPRNTDWRARLAWNAPNAGMAARSGAELLLDNRRKMTTVSGARNELL
ncbi:MAG: hypothetical protein JNK53_00120, partial [Phycisphaerae bacterium]|nr:hypothetical protein [Phycisphaerae bacterium]